MLKKDSGQAGMTYEAIAKVSRNSLWRHTREGGYPEVLDFKEHWIPDNPEVSGRECQIKTFAIAS